LKTLLDAKLVKISLARERNLGQANTSASLPTVRASLDNIIEVSTKLVAKKLPASLSDGYQTSTIIELMSLDDSDPVTWDIAAIYSPEIIAKMKLADGAYSSDLKVVQVQYPSCNPDELQYLQIQIAPATSERESYQDLHSKLERKLALKRQNANKTSSTDPDRSQKLLNEADKPA
jgi:hypothetical protein